MNPGRGAGRRRGALTALGLALLATALAAPAAAGTAVGAGTALDSGTTVGSAGDDQPGLTVGVTIPETGIGPVTVTGAQLRWGLSAEAGAGAFFGGCNFLVAGAVGDTGGGTVWTEADGSYTSTDGSVSIERPTADGSFVASTYATRCAGSDGLAVTTADLDGTGAEVVMDDGVGVVDRTTGTAVVRWEGSFTVVLYGGLTYWWASDPVLSVTADGTGTLTATASGFGSSMADMSRWDQLTPTTVVLAELRGVSLADPAGFTIVPEYVGVAVDGAGIDQAPRTDANAAYWGSFPQSLVDFLVDAGQAPYWFTSGGVRDPAKPATRLYASYDASSPVTRVDDPPPVGPGLGSMGVGGVGLGNAAAGPAGATSGPTVSTTRAAAAPSVATTDPEAAVPPALSQAQTVLPTSGLIPSAVTALLGGVSEPVLWSVGGLLSLSSIGVLGLLKGWLVLPWSR